MRSAITSFQQLVAIAPYLPGELLAAAFSLEEPLQLAYFIANHVRLSLEQRQRSGTALGLLPVLSLGAEL